MSEHRPPDLRLRAEQLGLFETPILHGHVADAGALCADLATAIRARRAADPAGLNRSNVGGWHSATDMLDWGGEPAGIDWTVRMWANVSPPGAVNMSHAHPGVLWAAVFYVDMGQPPETGEAGGELFFEDPRFPIPLMRLPGFRIRGLDGEPQPVERRLPTVAGDCVLFPAWLRHGVRPYAGKGERISIAMNIDVKA